MSNPVEWYVRDDSIQHGFSGHAIVRAPEDAQVEVQARILCELRASGLFGRVKKARFQSDARTYSLRSALVQGA